MELDSGTSAVAMATMAVVKLRHCKGREDM